MGPKVKLVGPYYIRTFGGTSRYLHGLANVARQDGSARRPLQCCKHTPIAWLRGRVEWQRVESPARWYAGSLQ